MKAGIVGLPNVGKSTLFNCLSNAKAQSANFPFCTIEPNIGVVNVPDPRLSKLEELVSPEKVIPATVEIVDIAGLVKGASKGEGLGNQFLGNIRETDAILHVLRCFDDTNIIHVDGTVDPIRDKETIDMELQLKDLEATEKKLEKVKRASRTGNKEAQKEELILTKIKESLEAGISIRALEFTEDDYLEFVKPIQFITDKPVLYVCNVDEASAVTGNAYVDLVKANVANENADVIAISTLLSTTQPLFANITKTLVDSGQRDDVYVIVGGGPVTPEWAEEIGADGYGRDAADAADLTRQVLTAGKKPPFDKPLVIGALKQ